MSRALRFANLLHRSNQCSTSRAFSVSAVNGTPNQTYTSTLAETFYNEEQLEIQRSFRKFIDTHINPYVDEWEKAEMCPTHEIFKKAGKLGYLGINKPTEYGGQGLPYKYHAALLEESAHANAYGAITSFGIQTDMTLPALANFGSHELKSEFLTPAIQGDTVACIGVSEPGSGSDVAGLMTNAKRDGDDLIINGQKVWISSGMQADWICLLANTSEGNPHKNKSLIIVPLNSKGVSRNKIKKIGLKCSDWAHIFFEDVRVPATNIIGEAGKGFLYQMLQFQEERLSMALNALRFFDRTLSITIDYTQNRKAFGKSILDNQVVHYRLAELATEVEALRALTYMAVDRYTEGEDVTLIASMAKLKAGRLGREITDTCLQFWGGMGYADETLISRFYRDARMISIAGGTDEVMLMIMCKILDILPEK